MRLVVGAEPRRTAQRVPSPAPTSRKEAAAFSFTFVKMLATTPVTLFGAPAGGSVATGTMLEGAAAMFTRVAAPPVCLCPARGDCNAPMCVNPFLKMACSLREAGLLLFRLRIMVWCLVVARNCPDLA